jgi:tetratricopeptide (TPR) repeat protein
LPPATDAPPAPADPSTRTALVLGALVLVVLVCVAFGRTLTGAFLAYDDPVYVTENEVVRGGLGWAGVRWAFTTGHGANWHPLTWLSHMADVSLYGLDARGHHATSLLLHFANALLVLLLVRSMTGAPGAALVVAALFAVHPTRLESVAWISERKDVLSTLLGLLATSAWVAWARSARRLYLVLAVGLHGLSLMAKAMLVTLPLLLLLLDFWPLRRLGDVPSGGGLGRRVREKWPFFALSAASGIVTVLAQRSGGAVQAFERFSVADRLANGLLSVGAYLADFAWPRHLAVFYPHPGRSASWAAALALALLLVALTVGAWRVRAGLPCLVMGWTWFLVALLPVSGLVQVGLQARADRYTYLPYLGLFLATVFAGRAGARRLRLRPLAQGVAAAVLLTAAALATRAEAAYWRDSRTLFERAREVTGPNPIAEQALGAVAFDDRDFLAAELHFRRALELRPELEGAQLGLGRVLVRTGRFDEAATIYGPLLARWPGHVETSNNLAFCRLKQGDLAQARDLLSRAVAANPRLAASTHLLGMLEAVLGRPAEALARLTEAARLAPGETSWRDDLEGARAMAKGEVTPASRRFRSRLAGYHREAAAARLARGRREEALRHSLEAERLEGEAAPPAAAPPGAG